MTLFAVALAGAAPPVRLAVVASSNVGVPGEADLRYADQDGRRVADLLYAVGGVLPGDVWLVPRADVAAVFLTLGRVTVRAQDALAAGREVELLVFYAGHAGSDGLHLGGEILPLADLKAAIRVVPATDRVVVLDACHAGTIAGTRGAALVKVDDAVEGFSPPPDEAWIVSSGPEERSFEVEDRRGALFTHFFLSGARGAADADANQRVTLAELYSFVQVHTAATAASLGQTQQPRWAGALGAWALTDLSASPSGVRVLGPLPEPLLVIDTRTGLVQAEVPRGAGANLALEPGVYQVVSVGSRKVSAATLTVPGDRWLLWEAGASLGTTSSVRTRGGLYDLHPWGIGAGATSGSGALGGGVWGGGATLVVHRNLGRGHRLEFAANALWANGADLLWEGRSTRWEVLGRWSYEWIGARTVIAPTLGAGPTLLWTEASRAVHPLWGTWYGPAVAEERRWTPGAALEAGVALRTSLTPRWSAEVLVAGGGNATVSGAVSPRATAQATVRGAFR